MATSLAGTIFQGNSQDAMIVEDAYKISTNETRNSIFEASKGIYKDAVKGLFANKNSARELLQLVKDSQNGGVNKMELLTRGLGAFGTSLPNLLGTIGGTLKNKLGDVAGDLITDDAKRTLLFLYDNVEVAVQVANIKDAGSLFEFVGELTGNTELAKFIDLEAESALIAGICSELMEFGIPELIDDVIDMTRSSETRKNAWAYISTEAVNGTDLALVSKIIDQIGLVAFLENNPNAINSILSSFFFGSKDTVETWPTKRAELVALLVKIDPYWNKKLRNGSYVANLLPYSVASADAKTLLMLEPEDRTYTLAAKGKVARNVVDVVKEMYPDAYIPV